MGWSKDVNGRTDNTNTNSHWIDWMAKRKRTKRQTI